MAPPRRNDRDEDRETLILLVQAVDVLTDRVKDLETREQRTWETVLEQKAKAVFVNGVLAFGAGIGGAALIRIFFH